MTEGEEKEGRGKEGGNKRRGEEKRKKEERSREEKGGDREWYEDRDSQMEGQDFTSVNKQGCGCCIRFLDSLVAGHYITCWMEGTILVT